MVASNIRARRKRYVIAEHNGSVGDGLVRWIHGAAAGANDGLAAGAIAVPNTNDDGYRHRCDSLHCDGAIETAFNNFTASWRCTAVAHHEQ